LRTPLAGALPRPLLARYLGCSAVAHLLWELLQLPLYTIWLSAPARELAYAVLHCTAGDLLIAAGTLVLAILVRRGDLRSPTQYRNTAVLAIALGLAYTTGSEWYNTRITLDWGYADAMPTVGGIGLGPLLQWLIVPSIAFGWTRRHV